LAAVGFGEPGRRGMLLAIVGMLLVVVAMSGVLHRLG
jgi:hypothetical protein